MKKNKGKSFKKKSNKKKNWARVAQYLVGKSGSKYIKFEATPKSSKEVKLMVKQLIKVLGTDVLFISLHNEDFREKYNVPDFVKGNINIDLDSREDDSEEDEEEDESEDAEESEDEDDSEEDEEEDESEDAEESEDDEDEDEDLDF